MPGWASAAAADTNVESMPPDRKTPSGPVGDELAPHREVDRRPRGLDPVAVAEVGRWLLEALDPEQRTSSSE